MDWGRAVDTLRRGFREASTALGVLNWLCAWSDFYGEIVCTEALCSLLYHEGFGADAVKQLGAFGVRFSVHRRAASWRTSILKLEPESRAVLDATICEFKSRTRETESSKRLPRPTYGFMKESSHVVSNTVCFNCTEVGHTKDHCPMLPPPLTFLDARGIASVSKQPARPWNNKEAKKPANKASPWSSTEVVHSSGSVQQHSKPQLSIETVSSSPTVAEVEAQERLDRRVEVDLFSASEGHQVDNLTTDVTADEPSDLVSNNVAPADNTANATKDSKSAPHVAPELASPLSLSDKSPRKSSTGSQGPTKRSSSSMFIHEKRKKSSKKRHRKPRNREHRNGTKSNGDQRSASTSTPSHRREISPQRKKNNSGSSTLAKGSKSKKSAVSTKDGLVVEFDEDGSANLPDLPPGWVMRKSGRRNCWYYFNMRTCESRWTKPPK